MTYDLQHAVERIRELEEKLEKAEARVDEYNQNYERAALECIKLQARVKELEEELSAAYRAVGIIGPGEEP